MPNARNNVARSIKLVWLISIAGQAAPGLRAATSIVESDRSAATFWQSYQWWLAGIALLLLIETILIVALLVKSAGRRRKEGLIRASQERLRRELAGFSRVAAVRELLSSLAHEINQPLAAILGNAEAAQLLMGSGAADKKELEEIVEDIVADDRRAAEVVRGLRSMLKPAGTERRPLGFNELIEEVLSILRNDFLIRKIAVDLDFGASIPSIAGDRIQLQQVILSLIVNAFEAMESADQPRKMVLKTRATEREAILDVVDTGAGIPEESLDSIFKVFVTTKPDRLGMGLFLSRSIVLGHNGRIWAENNADRGAAFHVALPLERAFQPALEIAEHRDFKSEAGQQSQGITILVADDRQAFRKAVSTILKELPELKLLAEAADGAEAVQKAAELKPDLVLLDIGLPLVHGLEAASRIRTVAPDAKILFLTQHDSPDFVGAALRAGALGYVLKVDVGIELLQAAKTVLRGEGYVSSGIRR